ncbi:MAG: ribosome maturation factor RimM [Actinomycetota bacterium]|nr:ribosome maturation factor RimM [Actinomycetota bacterium]
MVVELVTNRPERVAPGSILDAGGRSLEVAGSRPFEATGDGRWLVRFSGVDDRAGAEALRGAVLKAEPLEDADALWVHALIGAAVVDQEGTSLGRVAAVQANPASDLLVLDGGGLIPLVFVASQDGERIMVDIPPGLLEL